jgi:hypothetical protein
MPRLQIETSAYLDDSTTLIFTNKIDVAGALRPFVDFVTVLTATLRLKCLYGQLAAREPLTWDTLVALTNRLKPIEQQLKAEMQKPAPNALIIAAKNAMKTFLAYREAREALAEAYQVLTSRMIALLPNLPAPPVRSPADITP